jgi:hypothetical protein
MDHLEQETFEKLGHLCISKGFIHALAQICFNDNIVGYKGQISAKVLLKKYSWDRLIRTEISTLIGLMVKSPIDFTIPDAKALKAYVEETYALMQELHDRMSGPTLAELTPENAKIPGFSPFSTGNALREPIFYSGESAYSFQFRDLAVPKYSADDGWLAANKGFTVEEARDIVKAFTSVQNEMLTATHAIRSVQSSDWPLLNGFVVSAEAVAEVSQQPIEKVLKVLSAFSLPQEPTNTGFNTLHDFNVLSSTPLIDLGKGAYLLFEQYGLVQALYDSPFYWMGADKQYAATAMEHRGDFTENFVRERMEGVFGKDRVFRGVKISAGKGKDVTDIDVLVLFGNRAIIIQTKSKKLTLEARRGNDGQIQSDFQKGVQDAYDQGYEAASALLGKGFTFCDRSGNPVKIPALKEVFVICAVSDFYPALSFQSSQFLRFQTSESIPPAIITDVFAIDAMTEMLESPLWFMSYIERRTKYSDKLVVPDELTALSYHLRNNLWLDEKYDIVQLMDDFSCDLDAAMTVRREGLPGKATPEGVLTCLKSLTIEKLLKQVEARPEGAALDFAFTVLTCNEETVRQLSKGIDRTANLYIRDGKHHDFTMSIGSNPATGVIVHCNNEPIDIARTHLQNHCEKRKYIHKAETWYGICIEPTTKDIRFGLGLNYPWKYNDAMENRVSALLAQDPSGKIGRNHPCPCGSGKKYKRCCLD